MLERCGCRPTAAAAASMIKTTAASEVLHDDAAAGAAHRLDAPVMQSLHRARALPLCPQVAAARPAVLERCVVLLVVVLFPDDGDETAAGVSCDVAVLRGRTGLLLLLRLQLLLLLLVDSLRRRIAGGA